MGLPADSNRIIHRPALMRHLPILTAVTASMMAVTALSAGAQANEQAPASPAEARLRVPLDIPLTLSGNFGELRSNHFHSGLDFKTQGRTGLPVYSAADGYVSRVVVSPWGFGRAVYITHPDLGLTTVYGHLESFSGKIDTPVRDRQYEAETFRIDTGFSPGEIPVKRGEMIGHSGNSGSSGGPHLHMDVRNAFNEHALDPMAYYASSLRDDVRPEVRALALFPREGIVDGDRRPVYHGAKDLALPFKAWGRVTPGIKAYDRMTGTTNIYGIKYMTLTCDGDTVYRRVIDHFDFDRSRAVNTLVEYGDVVDSNSWFMITEVPESRPLDDMVTARGDGTLDIDTERDYRLVFILEDHHGNVTRVPFTIKGVKGTIPPATGDGELLAFDRENTVSADDGATATIPAATLYSDCIVSITPSDAPAGYMSRRYRVGDRHVPLAGNYTLTLPLTDDRHVDKRRYVIVRLDGRKPAAVESAYLHGGKIQARVNRFGDYAVTTDTIPPTITPVTPEKWSTKGRITYKIKDNLAGIDSYRCEIDGHWVLMELDGKTGTLSYRLDPKRLPAGQRHTVKLTVTDAAGNTATDTRSIRRQ